MGTRSSILPQRVSLHTHKNTQTCCLYSSVHIQLKGLIGKSVFMHAYVSCVSIYAAGYACMCADAVHCVSEKVDELELAQRHNGAKVHGDDVRPKRMRTNACTLS